MCVLQQLRGPIVLLFDSFWTYRVNLMVCARFIILLLCFTRVLFKGWVMLMPTSLHQLLIPLFLAIDLPCMFYTTYCNMQACSITRIWFNRVVSFQGNRCSTLCILESILKDYMQFCKHESFVPRGFWEDLSSTLRLRWTNVYRIHTFTSLVFTITEACSG